MSLQKISGINELNFIKSIKDKLIIIDFYADFCNPCKQIEPEIDNLSQEDKYMENCYFYKVNIEEEEEIANEFEIEKIPTFKLIKNSKILDSYTGTNIDDITNMINKNI